MRIIRGTIASQSSVLLLVWLTGVCVWAQDSDGDEGAPQTKVTPAIRTHVYDRMVEVQTCLDESDPQCALDKLGRVVEIRDLNSYEWANVWNFYAAAYFSLEDFQAASEAYEEILALPGSELPDGFVETTMKNLASAYWSLDRLKDALEMLDQWIALPTTVPGGNDYYLKGTLHYQIEEFEDGAEAVRQAIRLANDKGEIGEEDWYQLLAALYSGLGDTERVIETLTILVEHWTKREHVLRLAAQLSQAGRDTDALSLFEAAYDIGWLASSTSLVSLASMHLQAGVPYKAAKVLEKALNDGNVEPTVRNWSLLAQAWHLAKEFDKAILAFENASTLAEDGSVHVRLAQAYARRYRWEECIGAAQEALRRGELDAPDDAYLELGRCLTNLRRYDEAEAAFESAARYDRSRETAGQWLRYVFVLESTARDNEEKIKEANDIANGGDGTL